MVDFAFVPHFSVNGGKLPTLLFSSLVGRKRVLNELVVQEFIFSSWVESLPPRLRQPISDQFLEFEVTWVRSANQILPFTSYSFNLKRY